MSQKPLTALTLKDRIALNFEIAEMMGFHLLFEHNASDHEDAEQEPLKMWDAGSNEIPDCCLILGVDDALRLNQMLRAVRNKK